MKKTYDINIDSFNPLIAPDALKAEFPVSRKAGETVHQSRNEIQRILDKEDQRLLVVAGPCSIHDEAAALDYADRLNRLRKEVEETMMVVMRVYFEKPRTTTGWKGLINDPHLNDTRDMMSGIWKARKLLIQIVEMGLPTGTEMLDPFTPQYIAGLVSWSAIGARTTESQTHREMASGLSMPVGFKNCTDGGLANAMNAMVAAGSAQSFLGIDPHGQASVVNTTGNPHTHIVLRGGARPNYDSVSIRQAIEQLKTRGLSDAIVVDCSHANSSKKFENQAIVWQDIINQKMDGNPCLVGMMLESNIHDGSQKNTGDLSAMDYGVSITDPCISWETTEKLLRTAHDRLLQNGFSKSGAPNQDGNGRYTVAAAA
ncbi:MAG: 3-deoxy-7-phosphoheptulonate synthase [Desulfobacteraceae bacterium 4572_87]|nr:MAG: 3-deoxy-7-phosphoheptulonate synthase [Desulfobacteraceae bacterium 4572_87]